MRNEKETKSETLKKFESVANVFHTDCLIFRNDSQRCLRCLCRGKIWMEEHRGQRIPVYCGIYSVNGGEFE